MSNNQQCWICVVLHLLLVALLLLFGVGGVIFTSAVHVLLCLVCGHHTEQPAAPEMME